MSDNQKQQDAIEFRALEFVKDNFNSAECYGVTDKQYEQLGELLTQVIPNPNSNAFPDYISDTTFIEHFAVTSSVENKKGSKQRKESMIFKEKSLKNFVKNVKHNDSEIAISKSYSREMEEHSHTKLKNSIKRNWEKHLRSYEQNHGLFNIGIFLIEYTDVIIHTALQHEHEPLNVHYTYKIIGDRGILNWIYKNREKIKYLIFISIYEESIEIINLDNIPIIIKNTSQGIYEPAFALESHSFSRFKYKY